MSRSIVLDAEPLSILARPRSRSHDELRAALEAARRLNRDVIVPAVILAELGKAPRFEVFVFALAAVFFGMAALG